MMIQIILQLDSVRLMHNVVCKGEMNAHYKSINVHLMNIRSTKEVHISD